MWSSARFRRSANVLGLSSVDIQKSLKNCRTVSRRRSISCLLGEASDVMPIWWLSGRTATLSAIALLPPETRSFRLRRPVRLQYSWSGRCCSAARCSGRARRRQPIQSHKLRQSREASARCIMTPIARAGQSATLGLRRREGWRSTASFVWSMCSSGIGTTQRKCGRRTSAVGFVSSSSATSYLFIHTRGGIKMRPGVKDELFRLQDLASLRSQMLKLSSPMADRRLALVGCHQSMPTRRTPIDRG